MFKEESVERYITLVERWALGLGIIAAGGAFAYLPVVGKATYLGKWLIYPTALVGMSLIAAAALQFGRPLWAKPRSKKETAGSIVTWITLIASGGVAVLATAEWVDNQERVEICRRDEFSKLDECAPVNRLANKVRSAIEETRQQEAEAMRRAEATADRDKGSAVESGGKRP